MTVNNSANKVIAAGNGAQTVFGFAFIAVQASDLTVILTDSSGNETTLLPANYAVALNPVPPGQIWAIGGTVTYPLVGSPIPIGSSLTIVRELSLTQLVALGNQGNEFPSAVETALDLIEMQLQQVFELFQRAIVAPVVDATAPLPLPPIAQRANQGAAFDAFGNMIAAALPSSGVISSAMQPVVGAATLAAGRTAFGLGAMATEGIGAGLADNGSGSAQVLAPLLQVSTNQNPVAANHTSVYMATGALTFILPRANTLFDGFSIRIFALTANVTVGVDTHDNFPGLAAGVSFTIPKGSVATITTNAASSGTWYAEVAGVSPIPNVRFFTSSTTYTPSPGLISAIVEAVGAGGGGGGAQGASSNITSGGGGGGGGYARVSLTAAQIGDAQNIFVQQGGAGGVGFASGTGGGDSIFGLFLSALGGSGGSGGNSSSLATGGPGALISGAVGSVLIPGGDGSPGFLAVNVAVNGGSGKGGDSVLGFGGGAIALANGSATNGAAGHIYGGGGSGALANNNTGAVTGGAGAAGVVIVTEFLAFAS